jgi:chromosome segregation ATPase
MEQHEAAAQEGRQVPQLQGELKDLRGQLKNQKQQVRELNSALEQQRIQFMEMDVMLSAAKGEVDHRGTLIAKLKEELRVSKETCDAAEARAGEAQRNFARVEAEAKAIFREKEVLAQELTYIKAERGAAILAATQVAKSKTKKTKKTKK